MAFGKDENKNGKNGKDETVTDPTVDETPDGETETETKVEVPAGHVKVIDFASALTIERITAKIASGQPVDADTDYVDPQVVYGWIKAGMPNTKVGDGKRGYFVNLEGGKAWLVTYTPAKRGRTAMSETDKVKSGLAKLIKQAKELGIDPAALLAAQAPEA